MNLKLFMSITLISNKDSKIHSKSKSVIYKTYFDWARTPITSAYKSAIICTFPVLVPEYLKLQENKCSISLNFSTNFFLINLKIPYQRYIIFSEDSFIG